MKSNFDNFIKLKKNIQENKLSDNLLIFIDTEAFLTSQYINAIANSRSLNIVHIDKVEDLIVESDIFSLDSVCDNTLRVVKVDKFKSNNKKLLSVKDAIIVCKSIEDEESIDLFEAVIINFPKIPDWGVKDYVYSNSNLPDKAKEWLLTTCKNDIYRVKQELDKLSIFDTKLQPSLFEEFLNDGVFSDLNNLTVFDFINGILNKDTAKLKLVLTERENIDLEPLGVVTLLYKNLRNIIAVQMNPSATAASLGISDKQLAALRYRVNKFSNSKLQEMFNFIITIDEKLKTGFISEDQLIDYVLVNIL